MPNHPSAARTHFEATDRHCNKSNKFHQCRLCLAAARQALRAGSRAIVVEDIRARKENFEAHLDSCKYAPSWARPGTALFRAYSEADEVQAWSSSRGEQSAIPDFFGQRFASDEMEEFERVLIEFMADNQLPDSFIERSSTKQLFGFLNVKSVRSLPSRQVFGGRILDKFAKIAFRDDEGGLRQTQFLTEGRVNFLSDVWMNIARMHLLGCQLSLYGVVCALGLFPTGDRHDGLAIAEHMEKVMIQIQDEGWEIGAVVTDDAGQCARARRILALRWPKVIFLRCFAHMINNLVKGVLRTTFREVTAQASAVVTSLNASSSKWLVRVHKAMEDTYGRRGVLSLLPLCETRWNSMQRCFASLLRVRTALAVFVVANGGDSEFPEEFSVLNDNAFWTGLEEAEQVVRPLCFASFMLQHDDNTLSDVMFCFQQLYDSFSASSYSESLVTLLEDRWDSCEQPLFLLAYALDPRRPEVINELPVAVVDKLGDFALLYYRKIFDVDAPTIRGEMSEWLNGKYITTGNTINMFEGLATPPLAAFWQDAKGEKTRHGLGFALSELALSIFAMAVNTATCERYFSELALIHTARRNKMAAEKARKIAAIRRLVRERELREVKAKRPRKPEKRIVNPNEVTKLVGFGTPVRPRRSRRHTESPFTSDVNQVSTEECETPLQLAQSFDPEVWADADSDAESDDDEYAIDGEAGGDQDPLENWETVFEELLEADDSSETATGLEQGDATFVPRGEQRNPPFPPRNDSRFPQENRLTGDRAFTITLEVLFGVEAPDTSLSIASDDDCPPREINFDNA